MTGSTALIVSLCFTPATLCLAASFRLALDDRDRSASAGCLGCAGFTLAIGALMVTYHLVPGAVP